jgi:SAM-dependent methyltransferase
LVLNSTPLSSAAGDPAAVEQVLLRHPGVESAAVFAHAGRLLAFVVPAEAYLDESLDRGAAAAMALRKWQKTYDLNQSSAAAVSAPSGFNTIGWDSTYTRRPLSAEEMREWVQTSVDSILRLGPRAIYEIGCGSGLLLLRIAPHCDRYVGVDFSREVLARVREQLQSLPAVAARVDLMQRRADDFSGLEPRSFDSVVINSAVQYFPHAAYLAQVLENAVSIVRDGGHIFIGDVRSLPLLPVFAASVELFQAPDDFTAAELFDRIRRRVRHTPELVLSPAWFLALSQRLDRVAHVEIALRRGRADNEMTRYRYDAILRVGRPGESVAISFEPASADPMAQIHSRLRQSTEPFGIRSIPNARLEADRLAAQAIAAADPARSAASLRQELSQIGPCGVHPQEIFDLEAEHPGLRVRLSWAASRPDGSYDALLIPPGVDPGEGFAAPAPSPSACVRLANAPGQAGIRAQLIERLAAHCREHLPLSGAPDRFILVDAIPAGLDPAAFAQLSALDAEPPIF